MSTNLVAKPRVPLVEQVALAGRQPGQGVDERLDREGLAQHRRRAELIRLVQRLPVRGANDDRRPRVALLDPMDQRAREAAVVSMKTGEIGDDQIGIRVRRSVLQTLHEHDVVTLIAQHVAKEVADGPVVLNHQYVSYQRTLATLGQERNFDEHRIGEI